MIIPPTKGPMTMPTPYDMPSFPSASARLLESQMSVTIIWPPATWDKRGERAEVITTYQRHKKKFKKSYLLKTYQAITAAMFTSNATDADPSKKVTEYRRDQKEGNELDSHEGASPEEIWPQEQGGSAGLERERERWTSFASVVSQRWSYGHCLCDCVLHSSWDSNCMVQWSLRNVGRTLP